jgi:hypothetical protein
MGLFKRSLAAAILTVGSLSIPAADVRGEPIQPAQNQPAQTQPPQTQPPQTQENPSAAAPELSDQKLDAAAAALTRVVGLKQDYQQRFAQAEIPADKERIVAEANQELTKAITEQGISVEEYSSIMDAARDDPEVRGKILQRIRPADK